MRIMEVEGAALPDANVGGRAEPLSRRMPTTGFFTDSTLCIGCKACEVACKEWNDVPHDGFVLTGMSYDNTGALGHSTWRHVKFVERDRVGADGTRRCCRGTSRPTSASTASTPAASRRARPARSSAPSSAASSSSPTSATAAATASSPARSASSTAGPTTAARSSARSATTGRRPACSRRARRPVRRSRFSSATSTSCARARRARARRAARARHRPTPWSTIRARRASAARTRSSWCAATPRDYNLPANPSPAVTHLAPAGAPRRSPRRAAAGRGRLAFTRPGPGFRPRQRR